MKIKLRQLGIKQCVRKWCKEVVTSRQKNDAKMKASNILVADTWD